MVTNGRLQLVDQSRVAWKDRDFFLGVGAREMRRILIDHGRAQKRAKRGSGWGRVLLEKVEVPVEEPDVDILDIDEALKGLSSVDERQGRVVELRCCGGLTVEEVVRVLAISPKTVEKDW